jgi:hypothetical protein
MFLESPAEVVGVSVAVFVGHAFDGIAGSFEQSGAVAYDKMGRFYREACSLSGSM